ncbi:MAG: tRNA uridine-5-carboxymethylaminomethyl(34) synthesis GTPase MnmE [Tissierella sp.]|uniref:tRNA uridine-5-carboxymethylaminomethyl(34) synthesis GTPase MnmE n=1 Tax=Tissierella sp. TaxID=41274 RepID=UPI003F9E396C
MSDTIAAISTAVGEAGIGIVRMSGSDSINIGKDVFVGFDDKKIIEIQNKKLTYGHIIDEDGKKIDEVLIAFMEGPYTYTREDMVEIYCHGGIISVRKVLELLLRSGARLAERGEFTKIAFLNGRLDLSQAEAVIDIIRAKTDTSFQVSLDHLEGSLSKEVGDIRDILLSMVAEVEVSIDFPEEGVDELTYEGLQADAKTVESKIEALLATTNRGKILRDGIETVILGKPNVGKSSLLNAILRENRAIVTDIPGTTRDIIEEYVNIDGIPLKIIDTAGIRDTEDLVEKIGVDRAKASIEKADLIIGVFDVSREFTEEDKKILELLKNRKSIVLLNKIDLKTGQKDEFLKELEEIDHIIETSIIENIGIESLEEHIKSLFYEGDINMESDIVVTNVRHKLQLEKALKNIKSAIGDIQMNVPLDCIEIDLRNAWEDLGEISGDAIAEDILDKIFKDFCIGK